MYSTPNSTESSVSGSVHDHRGSLILTVSMVPSWISTVRLVFRCLTGQLNRLVFNNYSTKWRWIAVDIYRALKFHKERCWCWLTKENMLLFGHTCRGCGFRLAGFFPSPNPAPALYIFPWVYIVFWDFKGSTCMLRRLICGCISWPSFSTTDLLVIDVKVHVLWHLPCYFRLVMLCLLH